MPATKQIKEIETRKSKHKLHHLHPISFYLPVNLEKKINPFCKRIEKKKDCQKRVERIGDCSPEQNKLSKNDITSNLSLSLGPFSDQLLTCNLGTLRQYYT